MHPHPSPPDSLSPPSLCYLSPSLSSVHVHLHVCGKGVERVGDGGTKGEEVGGGQGGFSVTHRVNDT